MHKDISKLDSMYLDILKELGNIGTGNALTSLSEMTGKRLDMHVPTVKILSMGSVPEILGDAEKEVIGIYFELNGDINGNILFILTAQSATRILKMILGEYSTENPYKFNDMEISAISEVSNILVGSYVTALSKLLNLKMTITPPAYSVDMAGAILSVPAIQFGEIGDYVLYIETEFIEDKDTINGYIFLIPDLDGLDRIMKLIGADI